MPGTIHSGEDEFDKGSTDALSGGSHGGSHALSPGSHASSGPQSPLPAHPLTPLRGVHRVLRENILELCESMMIAVDKFATLNISKEYGVDLEDLSFEVFRIKLKSGMVNENQSRLSHRCSPCHRDRNTGVLSSQAQQSCASKVSTHFVFGEKGEGASKRAWRNSDSDPG